MIRGLSLTTILIYNAFALVFLVFILKKHKGDEIAYFIITLFFAGVATDFGKVIQNIYKIGILIWSIKIFSEYADTLEIFTKYRRVVIALGLFVIYVIFSGILIHHDSISLILSQLSKYIIPVLCIPILIEIVTNEDELYSYNQLFRDILITQIILSLIKLILIGNWYEGLVGSITGVAGGAVGTSLPLIGLCWLFTFSKKIQFNKTNILFMIGLLFIGFMAGKRAIWFLFPILFVILYLYIDKQKFGYKIFPIILFSPIIFYFGLRLSPSLNPENKVWGSFDPEYTVNYILKYNDIDESKDKYKDEVATGRVGANSLMLRMITDSDQLKQWQIWGLGSERILAADYEKYRDSEYYMGISSRGAVTGIVKFLLAYGGIGVILFLLFLFSIFFLIEDIKVRIVMSALLLFDFIFYNASICAIYAVFIFYLYTAFSLSQRVDEDDLDESSLEL